MTKRARGTGRVFKKCTHEDKETCVCTWYVRFSVDGKRYYKSAKSPKLTVAEKMLRRELAKADTGHYQGPQADRLSFKDLEGMLRNHYHAMRCRKRAEAAPKHNARHGAERCGVAIIGEITTWNRVAVAATTRDRG